MGDASRANTKNASDLAAEIDGLLGELMDGLHTLGAEKSRHTVAARLARHAYAAVLHAGADGSPGAATM